MTFRVGGPQSPFSISSSSILFFVLLPFFLKTKSIIYSGYLILEEIISNYLVISYTESKTHQPFSHKRFMPHKDPFLGNKNPL